MNITELLNIISLGETSTVQFKEKIPHPDSLAAEMIAMANTMGGRILIGIEDTTNTIVGVEEEVVREINQRVADIATHSVIPPLYVTTEIVTTENTKSVFVIHVTEGIDKPYKDKNGAMWIKQAADKRRLTDNHEIMRLFQAGRNLMADEMPVRNASIGDINQKAFDEYFQKIYNKSIESEGLSYEQALATKRVLLKGDISLGGLLFFGTDPQFFKTSFCIKAVAFFGNDMGGLNYRDSIDITGTIPQMFKRGMNFFESNLRHTQQGQSFNSIGKLEISPIALEELLQNALLHRDYFKNSPVRLIIFDNRIEILSPGTLPNNLTVEQIRYGNPVPRNNLLIAYAQDTMPYRGFGTGIRRALRAQANIEFTNDIEGEQFRVVIPRPQS